jgi:hypothetical protein
MRVVLICASLCFLTGCASEPGRKLEFGALGFEFAATERAVGILISALVIIVIALFLALVLRRRRDDRASQGQPFPEWLASVPGADPDLQELKKYSSDVHWNTDDLAALRSTIENDALISQADKVRRASTLGAFHDRWSESSHQGRLLAQLLHDVFENGIGIFLSLFALAVFISLAFGLSNSSFFSSLAQVDQARGLITFLVAVCAVAVIMLTAINIFWGNDAKFDERFKAAKDLVTLVVGVLGTILGFYFGSLTGDRLLQLSLDTPSSYSVVTTGSDIDLRATAKSGTPPYHFDLLVVDAESRLLSKEADNEQSDSGLISKKIKAPQTLGKHSIILLLRDAKGLQTKGSADFIVQAATKPPPSTGGSVPAPPPAGSSGTPQPAETPARAPPITAPSADAPPNPNATK